MTHTEVVNIAYDWIMKNARCGCAFREFRTQASNGEHPDVIGFNSWGYSVLLECKISRADFLSDRKKIFRAQPDQGMGTKRYFCCPTGLIKKEELQNGWGLIYIGEKGNAIKVKESENFDKNIHAEHGLMYSALRRIQKRNLMETIYDKSYTTQYF